MSDARSSSISRAGQQRSYKRYKHRPGPYLAKEFLAHIRATGSPESFAGIHPGPIDRSEIFTKLSDFSIERKKRPDGDQAYCPMCNRTNKFLEGFFIYLPRLQATAAIGHECAAKENRDAADKEYRNERELEDAQNYLLSNLPKVSQRILAVQAVRPAASEALRVFRALRQDASNAVKLLRGIKRKSGQLVISKTIDSAFAEVGPSGFKGSSGTQTREESFGILAGAIAVSTNFQPVAELNRIQAALESLPPCETEEDALEAICQMSRSDCKQAAKALRQTDAAFKRFQENLADFCAFFSPENINRINAWARHQDQHARFHIWCTEQDSEMQLAVSGYGDRLRIIISPQLHDRHADWPMAD